MKLIKAIINGQVRNISYKKVVTWYSSLWKPSRSDPPYNHVVQIGDPILRNKAYPISVEDIKSQEVQNLIARMKQVFKRFNCVGLAAPQIGIPFQVFVMEFSDKHMKSLTETEKKLWEVSLLPFTVVINPEIKITDYTKNSLPEGCQSIKGFHAEVPRYRALELKGFDANGNPLNLTASAWTAKIIQHEVDHLNGRLFTDVMDRKTLTCSCWEIVNERRGRVEMPYGPE